MGMLTLPLAIQPRCLKCGTTELSSLIATTLCVYEKQVKLSLGKSHVQRTPLYREGDKFVRKRCFRVCCSQASAVSHVSGEQNKGRLSTFLFRTDVGGGLVKVFVRKQKIKYDVSIEVSSLQLCTSTDKLVLNWGIFRSNSTCFVPLDFQGAGPKATVGPFATPFVHSSVGRFDLDLDFEARETPFYLSFSLKSISGHNSYSLDISSHRKTSFVVPVGFSAGFPTPLGLSFTNDGSINFALLSRNTENVVLCLYDEDSVDEPALELDLDPYVNRSGDIWHVALDRSASYGLYGYRCKGGMHDKRLKSLSEHVVLDPYAKIVELVPENFGSGILSNYLGQIKKQPTFKWTGDVRLCLPMEKLVVYRLNVMRFTKDVSSKLPSRVAGSFSGLTEKLHHFKDIGVNAVLLEPIFLFDEAKGPYFPCHFFSPTNLYEPSSGPVPTISSLKEMVKKLHANGIEVLMEVVFTHTAENVCFRAIDNSSYYCARSDGDESHRNALNCNYPIVQQMILDSLRHWVVEFHIDGFCFINASSLLRGFHGEQLSRPPLVEAIAFDPILSNSKIIADTWDPHHVVTKDIRFPHWKRWAEMNVKFCDDVRNFLRGQGLLSNFATRLCGSGDRFSGGRGPAYSFNFVARNTGLSLVDLVSFSGSEVAAHLSWNCGEEGPTNSTAVLERRLKQIRNYLFILFVSQGVPVLNMGDEWGQSSWGSPEYGDRKPFNWNALSTSFAKQTTQFISYLGSLRARRADTFQRRSFMKVENIDWRGRDQSPPRWDDPSSKFLAMTLKANKGESQASVEPSQVRGDLFIVFNADDSSEGVILPTPPVGMSWLRLVDTALPFPGFFSMEGVAVPKNIAKLVTYDVKSHSCALFEARSLSD